MEFNPATGLPMLDDAGIDVGGSPFGIDIHADTEWTSIDSGICDSDNW